MEMSISSDKNQPKIAPIPQELKSLPCQTSPEMQTPEICSEDLSNPGIKPVIGVFDFDGTLTYRDSFLPFIQKAVGRLRFWWGMFLMLPVLIGLALGLIPNWQAKETFLTHFFAHWPAEQLHQVAQRFAVEEIPKMLRSEAVQRLKWHQQQGHRLILISASLENYVQPWAQTMGFEPAIATQLEVQNGLVTGRILGKNCYGTEKVDQLKELLGDLSQYCLYVYGDSRGDRELLAVATYPYYRKFEE